jgi:hypothetical protein
MFNNVKAKNLGGGVILFENAINLDWKKVVTKSSDLIQQEWEDMYKPALDPETGEEVYINKSGYFFGKNNIDSMPMRASAIHLSDDEYVQDILLQLEECRDKYLLKYLEIFPLAYKCIWWKVKGHILKYKKGVYLGSHSDISADYVYDVWEPKDQLALRNVVTCLIYFNSSVSSNEEIKDDEYVGGSHYFNYLDIEYTPKAGDIMFFPSNYMAAHEVKPVTSGERYSYLGWYSQGTPNPAVHEYVADPIKEPELATKATNVYIPTLREDFRSYLLESGYSEDSPQLYITKSNH